MWIQGKRWVISGARRKNFASEDPAREGRTGRRDRGIKALAVAFYDNLLGFTGFCVNPQTAADFGLRSLHSTLCTKPNAPS